MYCHNNLSYNFHLKKKKVGVGDIQSSVAAEYVSSYEITPKVHPDFENWSVSCNKITRKALPIDGVL